MYKVLERPAIQLQQVGKVLDIISTFAEIKIESNFPSDWTIEVKGVYHDRKLFAYVSCGSFAKCLNAVLDILWSDLYVEDQEIIINVTRNF